MLVANLLLAFTWAALQGEFTLANLVIGFVLGYLVLGALARGGVLPSTYGKRANAVLSLATFLFWAFIVANIRMAIDVVRPQRYLEPGIVRVPLDARGDYEILLLTTIINLTPGTIAVDVTSDRTALFLHVMHVTSPDEVRAEIKESFERRVLEIMR